MTNVTVIGASGFVGSALATYLRSIGMNVATPRRDEQPTGDLGHVFFCAGLTADFRSRLFDTIEAHVTAAASILKHGSFASFVYLSSTRVYQRSVSGAESEKLVVDPQDPSDVYNLSKLTGEAICLADARPTVKVVRLSNIFGPGDQSDNFLTSLLRDARTRRQVHIQGARVTSKDYIALDDVIAALARVPTHARSRLINIASGISVSNGEIGDMIEVLLDVPVTYGLTPGPSFPAIDNCRMREELGIHTTSFSDAFARMAASEPQG